ncbi:putative disease resistance protein RGA1 isoform X2 [Aegilops tauschii subsp. strangulata]|uniref:putative disease resistance protein RGA1 isoform X2 n=1 Tax=Aegilops tauschii subsp. strangulata TaxID=200361 RepID=UPI003CC8592D
MSLSATGIISAVDDCVNLFQWTRSAIPSLHSALSGSQQESLQEHVLRLQGGLQCLRDALPAIYDLIDRAERRSHDTRVEKLLPLLKDLVYEVEDLLDEAKWYEVKAQVEGNATQSPPPLFEFIDDVLQGSSFGKLIKPKTGSLPYEGLFFCYYKELAQVMGFSTNSKCKRATSLGNASTSASANNQFSNGLRRISSLPVLVIQGTGGVGKTTLARRIWFNQTGKPRIIWIHVSDGFDVKRLTKKAIQLCTGEETTTDDLDSLQDLSKHVSNKRLLVFLDDMRDDALKENGQCWKRFCAPFRNVRGGSMILVTTRCSEVTEGVRTMEPIILDGLKGDVFWNFFKLCVFGDGRSEIDPELERIGRSILPKLKGSPLAAKTMGRMLSTDLQASHWNSILESELWELRQEEADIFPALQLSYMHLPFYLKRCFAFCSVYPKDCKFQKAHLAEVWVAEGFVESQDIGCQYFEDLVTRSFFQMVRGGYVIPDLLHDLAQKVSEHDCFILRNDSCFDKVPQDVRHLYVLPSSDFDGSNLLRLCRYTKLRTLICEKSLGKEAGFVMGHWCTKLLRMRVISCASTDELPGSIGNLKHLRYLEISRACALKRIPSTFRWLYNLQIFYAKKCKLESLPSDFGKLINLQKFESDGLPYYPGCRMRVNAADGQGQRIVRLMKNLNQFHGLEITHVGMLTKDDAVESKLKNKKDLDELKLIFESDGLPISPRFLGYPESQYMQDNEIDMLHQSQIIQDNEIEVLQSLQPPISLKSLFLQNYAGVSLPSWFRPQNIPILESLTFRDCAGLKSISLCMISQIIGLNLIPAVLVHNNNDSVGMFLSLTDLAIYGCRNLSTLEHFLLPKYVPAMKKIAIGGCKRLESIPTEMFGDFHFLEELNMVSCPKIRSRRLVSPSLKKLRLSDSALFYSIECCSLTYFHLSSEFVMSIQLQMWSLPALRELHILCRSLTSIGGSTNLSLCTGTGSIRAFSSLSVLSISHCDKLSTLDDLLTQEYLPAIEEIAICFCGELLSLPGERFGSFSYLKDLRIDNCRSLNWQRGLVLPSSLQRLSLHYCGDMFSSVPNCFNNLMSLVSLTMKGCQGIRCIPGDIWRCDLTSLELLEIRDCPDLVSIGGAKAVEKIKSVWICGCPNLKGVSGILRRCSKG